MSSKVNIKELSAYFQKIKNKPLEYDEKAISLTYQKSNTRLPFSVKMIAFFGTLLTSITSVVFCASMFSVNTYLITLIVVVLIIATILLNLLYDNIFADTISMPFYICGFALLYTHFDFNQDNPMINSVYIIISFITLLIVPKYMISLISTLIINGTILKTIFNFTDNLSYTYNFIHVYTAILVGLVVVFFLTESIILKEDKVFSKIFSPVKTGLTISLVLNFGLISKHNHEANASATILFLSIVIILLILFIIYLLFNILEITKMQHRISIYVLTILALAPLMFSPAILGSILIILLSFLTNHKSEHVLGILSLVVFISMYYYNTEFTLLTKSILLFSSGMFFITYYLFTYKKLISDEKI